jgi:ATP-dependent DNA helicase RecQ
MNDGGDLPDESGWVESSIARCTHALASATRAADRVALIRSLIRLRGGRIDLSDLDRQLTLDEFSLLSRFGLGRTNSDRSLRIIDEEDAYDLNGLGAALKFDPTPRQTYEPASPDGVLLRLTNHSRYRTATQKAATRALLTQPPGSGLLVSMPTGSGKSLLFQIAANYEREIQSGACSVVITPTIALALDHERTLSAMPGLERSKALTGDTPPAETESIINDFRRGQVPILLLSPEKALSPSTLQYLVEAATPHSVEYGLDARLTHIFVDEAHIVESWGRSFRPDFQRLPALLARLRIANPEIRAVLLSATLPDSARRLLKSGWTFDGAWLEVDARLPRYEHDVVVAHYEWESERQAALDYLVDRAQRPLIIYTTQIADACALCARLMDADHGYARVALFTGDTGSQDRRRIVEDWAKDQIDIVVATSAFGLGIDKADVRSVIHCCLPESPARWYQEIGRASRDSGQGLAACLFVEGPALSDVKQAYSLATSGWLTRELAEARWTALLKAASNQRYVAELMHMTLDLDAFREGLRPTAGDWNRGWNMTLLTLMQRAGVLRVLSIPTEGDQPEFFWEIEIRDPRALKGVDDDVWQRISDIRDAELAEARADLDAFVAVMRHSDRACVTRTAFEVIEPRSLAPPCGRCPACRKSGVTPPVHLDAAGLEKSWPDAVPRRGGLPVDVLLVTPLDADFERGLPSLIKTLTLAGVEQIVVPQGLAHQAAALMVHSGTRLGLVVDEREWSAGNQLANVTTAILMPVDSSQAQAILDRLDDFRSKTNAPVLVVARPERVLRGRRLDQTVSRYAPYAEDQLMALASGGDVAG